MMLIAASCPSKCEAAVTKRTGCVEVYTGGPEGGPEGRRAEREPLANAPGKGAFGLSSSPSPRSTCRGGRDHRGTVVSGDSHNSGRLTGRLRITSSSVGSGSCAAHSVTTPGRPSRTPPKSNAG